MAHELSLTEESTRVRLFPTEIVTLTRLLPVKPGFLEPRDAQNGPGFPPNTGAMGDEVGAIQIFDLRCPVVET